MATLPNPQTFVQFTVPDATDFNLDIRDAAGFFLAPPRATVRQTSNQVVTNSTWEVVTWSDEDADTDAMWSSGASSRLIAKTAGRFQFWANAIWEWFGPYPAGSGPANGGRCIMVRKNAAGAVGSGTEHGGDRRRATDFLWPVPPASEDTGWGLSAQSCTGFVTLAVNDYIELFVWADEVESDFIGDGTPVDSSLYHTNPDFNLANVRFTAIWINE